ncbi:LytTR family DNA-binding domain-containing protein [Lactococcus termiticola]|uniref:LytR family transcriptional regulator n=1 Tax=Lactococcus termiticola TaxID=2169526 RepID=A0A2R5HJZ2_9LACT|nr:LytTR family DNA-binding domain-containing protein [Lactococcus termiticola]GBG97028.1 LytR family transcriptional regulator [Lactococcus termiticola]
MKLFKEIIPGLKEPEVLIRACREEDYQQIAQRLSDKVEIETTKGIKRLNKPDIIYVEALKNYVELHTTSDSIQVRMPLYKMKEKLGEDFIQVSRSYLINFQGLSALEVDLVQGLVARVSGLKIPVTRSFVANLEARIEKEQEK